MSIGLVLYDWNLRPVWMEKAIAASGAQSDAPRLRKFLLFDDGGQLTIVAGPCFTWPMEYHHFLLRQKYHSDHGKSAKCLGGGVLFAERDQDGEHQAQLAFWKKCVCGKYNDELASMEDELSDVLQCKVKITLE